MKRLRVPIAVLLLAGAFAVAGGVIRHYRAAPAVAVSPALPMAADATAMATNPVARKHPLVVAFRLDRELTQGMFLGERWVSPPSFFFAQPGTQYVVHAKAQTIDGHGDHVDVRADWAPVNPQMLAVSRGDLGEVTLVVREPGESDLTVSAGGEAKVLHVSANRTADAMQVDFRQ